MVASSKSVFLDLIRAFPDDDGHWRSRMAIFLQALASVPATDCTCRESLLFDVLTTCGRDWSGAVAQQSGVARALCTVLLEDLPLSANGTILRIFLALLAGKASATRVLLVDAAAKVFAASPSLSGDALRRWIARQLRESACKDGDNDLRSFTRALLRVVARCRSRLCPIVLPLLMQFAVDSELKALGGEYSGGSGGSCKASCDSYGYYIDATMAAYDEGEGSNGEASEPFPSSADPTPQKRHAAAAVNRGVASEAPEDSVLEVLMRWMIDVGYQQCSRRLSADLEAAVFAGVRQTLLLTPRLPSSAAILPSAALATTAASPAPAPRAAMPPAAAAEGNAPPVACGLLLTLLGNLGSDGGSGVAVFLQRECGSALRRLRPRASSPDAAAGRCSILDGSGDGGAPGSRTTFAAATAAPLAAWNAFHRSLSLFAGFLCQADYLAAPLLCAHLRWLLRHAVVALRAAESLCPERLYLPLRHAVALVLICRADSLRHELREPATADFIAAALGSERRPLGYMGPATLQAALVVLRDAGIIVPSSSGSVVGEGTRRAELEEVSAASASLDLAAGAAGAFPWSLRLVRSLLRPGPAAAIAAILAKEAARARRAAGGGRRGRPGLQHQQLDLVRFPPDVLPTLWSFLGHKRLCRSLCVSREWRETLAQAALWRGMFLRRWPLVVVPTPPPGRALDVSTVEAAERSVSRKRRRVVVHWRHYGGGG
ncbi:unnamed protein product, partial [Phaeothamnion confervicola]